MAEGNPQFSRENLAKRVQGMRELLVVLQQVDKDGDHQLSAAELAEAVIVTRGKERAGQADPWKDIREQLASIRGMKAGEAAQTDLGRTLQAVPDGIAFKLKDAQGFAKSVEARNEVDEAERAARARQSETDATERQALVARIGAMLPPSAKDAAEMQELLGVLRTGEVSPAMRQQQNNRLAAALDRGAAYIEEHALEIAAKIDSSVAGSIADAKANGARVSAEAAARANQAAAHGAEDGQSSDGHATASGAGDSAHSGLRSAKDAARERQAARLAAAQAQAPARIAEARAAAQQVFNSTIDGVQAAAPSGKELVQQGLSALRERAREVRAHGFGDVPTRPAIDPAQLREIAELGKQLAAYKPQDIAKLGVGDIERALPGAKPAAGIPLH